MAFGIDAQRLLATLDSLHEGIQILSPEWRYLYVNAAAARHGRKLREELLGRTMSECYPGIERAPLFAALERCLRDRTADSIENEFQYEDGRRAWFQLRIEPCPEGLIVLSLDVTEEKRLEAILRQGQKLRALGQLAASVAHDLKNILNPIGLQLRLLRNHLAASPPETDALLARIEDALRTGADTVERLRAFSRREPDPATEPVDLDRKIETALGICAPRVDEHGRLVVRHEPGAPPRVQVRASELVNAIVNLVVNAMDALPGGGTIVVRSGSGTGDDAWIEVADDGPGMPPEVEARLFEPFFTTKASGTGLGLAMVYAFAQRHGGRALVTTAAGRGTTVRLSFPVADGAAPLAIATPAGVARAAQRRLLLVEDEPVSRQALQTLLAEEGFQVAAAATGEEAIARLGDGATDVLVTDYRLPGVDGIEVARFARARNAALPVVILSGHDEANPVLASLLREPNVEHMAKPVDIDRLVALVERMRPPG